LLEPAVRFSFIMWLTFGVWIFQIPIEVDTQFAGLVEAWAAGVTWKELMSQCGMDDGDVARLIRRSIDLLAQVALNMK
jgi:superfamily II RNA helicase